MTPGKKRHSFEKKRNKRTPKRNSAENDEGPESVNEDEVDPGEGTSDGTVVVTKRRTDDDPLEGPSNQNENVKNSEEEEDRHKRTSGGNRRDYKTRPSKKHSKRHTASSEPPKLNEPPRMSNLEKLRLFGFRVVFFCMTSVVVRFCLALISVLYPGQGVMDWDRTIVIIINLCAWVYWAFCYFYYPHETGKDK